MEGGRWGEGGRKERLRQTGQRLEDKGEKEAERLIQGVKRQRRKGTEKGR